nr:MAG TPA: hypothetical protein [Caudoviricetes sp.]
MILSASSSKSLFFINCIIFVLSTANSLYLSPIRLYQQKA